MSTTLSVWEFDTPSGAADARGVLDRLETQDLVTVNDGAIVSWDTGARRPRTTQFTSTTKAGALGGSFWGFLFGVMFFVPLIGMALGAATGAVAGALTDVGIDDGFIKRVREDVKPGTSALFVLTSETVVDRVAEAVRGTDARLLQTNLSDVQEGALREAFAA